MESPRTPMHLGGIYIFAPPASGGFDFDAFKRLMHSRIHLSRVFRERMVEVPLDLGYPYWVEDPDFDLEYHINHVALPPPGDENALMELAARTLARPLDLHRPLWRLLVVDGLDGIEGLPKGAFALISLVHHAAIDGISGTEIMSALFDMSPRNREVKAPDEPWNPKDLPTQLEMVARATGQAIGTPWRVLKFVTRNAGLALDTAAEVVKNRLAPPAMPFNAPKVFFNAEVSGHRIFRGKSLAIDRIKAIKNAAGVKFNDVLLAVCAGALRSYLLQKSELPEEPLVAMAPISMRLPSQKETAGNEVSAMLVPLATDQGDPLERLQSIHKDASASKLYGRALSANQLMDLVPSEITALATRTYTRMHLGDRLNNPPFNLVITNVPGPPMPLFLNGAQMIQPYSMAPLIDGLGLLIVLFSYAGRVYIGAFGCRELLPDLDLLMDKLQPALEDLEVGLFQRVLTDTSSPPQPQSPKVKAKRKSPEKGK
jgi:diacylglycerol O-acyltransferase